MLSFFVDYNNCKNEIEYYFRFLDYLESNSSILNSLKIAANDEINLELPKIMKANAFVMLYNLVESTIKNNLWEIFQQIKISQLSYSDLTYELKNVVLLKKAPIDFKTKDETITKQIISIIEKALTDFSEYFPKNKQQINFETGNLDIEKIKNTFISHGIAPVPQTHTDQVEAFSVTVRNRNHLAHGDQTFGELGKNYSFLQINEYKNYIFEYLDRTISETENYILQKRYKI